MLEIRRSGERGHGRHGWLDSYHTFSFADYHDPAHMGFRALRVINEDKIAPGRGFGTHGHQDMEILTYVLSGELAHKDSLGPGGLLKHGEVQHMSAGTGIRHSETNPSRETTTHMMQIWLLPNQTGVTPSHEQKLFPIGERPDRLQLIASRDGREGSFAIRSDAEVYAGVLLAGTHFRQAFRTKNGWIQVAAGEIAVNGQPLRQGDGVAITDEDSVRIGAETDAEILVFDLD